MHDKTKERVLDAFLLVMRPVVRILFRYGIGFREFAEVVKTAFVDVASSDFGLRGRPTNISRVAVMTGLTRKEVRRLRDKIDGGDAGITIKTTPLSDVLHHWHAQGEFTDKDGTPKALPFSGESGSFAALVKKYGGDIPPGAMKTEMIRVGVVREDESGNVQMVRRSYVSDKGDENLVTMLVHGVYPMLTNIMHNTNPERSERDWGYRIAYTQALPLEGATQLRRIAADRIAEFAESIDDVFIAYESFTGESEGGKPTNEPIAVGVFYFEERDSNAKYSW